MANASDIYIITFGQFPPERRLHQVVIDQFESICYTELAYRFAFEVPVVYCPGDRRVRHASCGPVDQRPKSSRVRSVRL